MSVFGDYFPNRHDTVELRGRLFVEEKIDKELEPSTRVIVTASVSWKVFWRGGRAGIERQPSVGRGRDRAVQDGNVDILGSRLDVLVGYARIAWGRLDEIQPADVINPLDVSKFFFDGRSEARLPMLLGRVRLHLSESVNVDGIYLPDFRRGHFDQPAEPSSPFNLPVEVSEDPVACLAIGCPAPGAIAVSDQAPAFTVKNAQGGARVSATTGRVDCCVGLSRVRDLGLYTLEAATVVLPAAPTVAIVYPRFTMIGGDFEAVRGKWGMRGEVAAFVDDNFQSADLRVIAGHSFDAGVGVDRRAGDYTLKEPHSASTYPRPSRVAAR